MSELENLVERINGNLSAEQVLQMLQFKLDRIEQVGTALRAFCPIHRDNFLRTLLVETGQKRFRCNYGKCPGTKGGTLFELYRLAEHLSAPEAAINLAQVLGIQVYVSLKDLEKELESKETGFQTSDLSDSPAQEPPEQELEVIPLEATDTDDETLKAMVEDVVHNIEENFQPGEEVSLEPETPPEPEIDIPSLSTKLLQEELPPLPSVPSAPPLQAKPFSLDELFAEEISPGLESQTNGSRDALLGGEDYQGQKTDADSGSEMDWQKLYQAGMFLFEENRYRQAESKLTKAFELAPTEEDKARVVLTLAKCHLEGKQPSDAISLLEEAMHVEDLPLTMGKALRKLLANAYERKGDISRATQILKAFVNLYGDDVEVLNKLRQLDDMVASTERTTSSGRRISFL